MQFDRKFSGTTGRPSEVFHFFSSNRLEQKFPFHLRNSVSAGGWRLEFFPPFPMFAGERCSRAVTIFLFILILSFKIASSENSPLQSVLISSNKTATNCCYCHSHWKLLSLLDFWFTRAMIANEALWLESLSIWPGVFLECPTGSFA